MSSTTEKQPTQRADARRNREKLLANAARAFAAGGVNTSLEEIARLAGVGVGTLYRHFPSREALVAATYRNEVEQLYASVAPLQAAHPPEGALRAWMDGFVRYAATKRGMGEALQSLTASDSALFADGRRMLVDALDTLVDAAVAAKAIRADARGEDVLAALGAVWSVRDGPDREQQVVRILDLLMDGLRYGAPA